MGRRKKDNLLVLLIGTLVFVNKAKGDYDETCETPALATNTCGPGKFLDTDNGCHVCPEGHFQNLTNHECRQCKKCTECGDGKVINRTCSLNKDTKCIVKNATTCSRTNLPDVTDGSFYCALNSDIPEGDACNLKCNDGFYPASSNQTVCEVGETDQAGQWSNGNFSCLDGTPPTVSNCPIQRIRRTASAGTCQVIVTWTIPTATDASGIASTDVNFQSGSSFPVGNTTVRYTFVDEARNAAFCVFDVIVTDTTPPTVSNCPTQPIRRTAPAGTSEVTVMWTTPTATDASGIVSTVNFQSGSSFPVGNTTVRYTFVDKARNTAFCVFWVIVTDGADNPNWPLIGILIFVIVVLCVALAGSISFHCKPEWKETVMVKLCGRNGQVENGDGRNREAENGDGRNHQVENGDGRNRHHDLENGNVDTTEMSTFLQPNGQP